MDCLLVVNRSPHHRTASTRSPRDQPSPGNDRLHWSRRTRWGRRRHSGDNRKGTATVEFALIAPLLLTLTIGTIDVCSAIFLREAAVLAAYEGARQGVARGGDNGDVSARVQDFLNQRNIAFDGAVVQISSPGFSSADTLEAVTVTVNIPAEGNLLIPSQMIGNLVISANVTMLKEFENVQAN